MAANAGMYASTAARRAGMHVRYADVDGASLTLAWPHVERVLDDSVALVIVTHLYGRMAETEAIVEGCRRRDIRVLEDCAQAIGALSPAGRAGSLADAGAFSFYPTKISVRSATAARSRRRGPRWPSTCDACANTVGARSTRSPKMAGGTAGWTSCRPPFFAFAYRASTLATRAAVRSSPATPKRPR